jgi:hypothetical protein
MALVALLLANGYAMSRTERRIRSDAAPDASRYWTRLRFTATASLLLWLAITLAGVLLVNAA